MWNVNDVVLMFLLLKLNKFHTFLRICSYLIKKSLTENFIFCTVKREWGRGFTSKYPHSPVFTVWTESRVVISFTYRCSEVSWYSLSVGCKWSRGYIPKQLITENFLPINICLTNIFFAKCFRFEGHIFL